MHIGIFCDAWATMELFHIVLCWQLFLSLATQQVSIRWFSTWARCLTLLVPDHEELFKEHEKSNKNKGTISYAGSDLTSEADKYSEWGSRVHYGSNSESIRMERNFFDGNLGQLEASGKRLSVTVSHFPIFFSPISSRAFVLPSDGIIADSCVWNRFPWPWSTLHIYW